jgi:hypothetical protein
LFCDLTLPSVSIFFFLSVASSFYKPIRQDKSSYRKMTLVFSLNSQS